MVETILVLRLVFIQNSSRITNHSVSGLFFRVPCPTTSLVLTWMIIFIKKHCLLMLLFPWVVAFPWCQSYSIFRVVDASTLYQNKIEADKPKQPQEEVLTALLRGCQLNAPPTDSRVQQAREEQLKKALEDQDYQRRIEHQHLENVKKRLEIERRNVSEAERRHDEQVAAEHSRQERDALLNNSRKLVA
jgi:hypothetical protein